MYMHICPSVRYRGPAESNLPAIPYALWASAVLLAYCTVEWEMMCATSADARGRDPVLSDEHTSPRTIVEDRYELLDGVKTASE